jgi:hypothetical protein
MGCVDGEEVGMKRKESIQLSHKPLVCGRIITLNLTIPGMGLARTLMVVVEIPCWGR